MCIQQYTTIRQRHIGTIAIDFTYIYCLLYISRNSMTIPMINKWRAR